MSRIIGYLYESSNSSGAVNACTRDDGADTVLLVLVHELNRGDVQEHCLLSAPLVGRGAMLSVWSFFARCRV